MRTFLDERARTSPPESRIENTTVWIGLYISLSFQEPVSFSLIGVASVALASFRPPIQFSFVFGVAFVTFESSELMPASPMAGEYLNDAIISTFPSKF